MRTDPPEFVKWVWLLVSTTAFGANLFPLDNGTYREAISGETFTVRVGTPVVMNDRVYYSLGGYVSDRVFVRMEEQSNRLLVWDENRQIEVPLISFQPAGLWWEAPFRGCEQEGQSLIAPGTHEGQTGFFESVLEIQYRFFGCGEGVHGEQFARNYGMLRRVVASASGPRQFDLVSANIGGMTLGISAPFMIPSSRSLTRTTLGGLQLEVGYARIQSVGNLVPVAGLAMFGLRQNGVLISETGMPAVSPVNAGRVFAEVAEGMKPNSSFRTGTSSP
jgi:hypothetical protein